MTLHPREEVLSWTPETEADRRLVQEELSTILAGPHFRNSKRYPALLRYVVEKALDGQADQLKERMLGVEVFDRRADYDTNADPVVRFSASEVRKRIAQHYHELETEPALQIELPLGSYAPQFRLRFESTGPRGQQPLDSSDPDAEPPQIPWQIEADAGMPAGVSSSFRFPGLQISIAVTATLFLLSTLGILVFRSIRARPSEQLWNVLAKTSGPVLVVIGSGNLELTTPESPITSMYDHMVGPYHHVSVSTAVALARLVTVLERHQKSYIVKEASATSLTDLRERSVVLVGGRNNAWTLRLLNSLRFHFARGAEAYIEDRDNPSNKEWAVDLSKPFASVSSDYAIVARYHDHSTNGNLLIIAGLGPYGTEAASEFVASPQYLEQINSKIPGALTKANVEFVLRTDVIAGEAGPPYLVAASNF